MARLTRPVTHHRQDILLYFTSSTPPRKLRPFLSLEHRRKKSPWKIPSPPLRAYPFPSTLSPHTCTCTRARAPCIVDKKGTTYSKRVRGRVARGLGGWKKFVENRARRRGCDSPRVFFPPAAGTLWKNFPETRPREGAGAANAGRMVNPLWRGFSVGNHPDTGGAGRSIEVKGTGRLQLFRGTVESVVV